MCFNIKWKNVFIFISVLFPFVYRILFKNKKEKVIMLNPICTVKLSYLDLKFYSCIWVDKLMLKYNHMVYSYNFYLFKEYRCKYKSVWKNKLTYQNLWKNTFHLITLVIFFFNIQMSFFLIYVYLVYVYVNLVIFLRIQVSKFLLHVLFSL